MKRNIFDMRPRSACGKWEIFVTESGIFVSVSEPMLPRTHWFTSRCGQHGTKGSRTFDGNWVKMKTSLEMRLELNPGLALIWQER